MIGRTEASFVSFGLESKVDSRCLGDFSLCA
jgi:hypothetical protein